MKIFIFTGGTIDIAFAKEQLSNDENVTMIAVDRGLEACLALGITPEYIIGDFDSVSAEGKAFAEKHPERVTRLQPVKDDTDTEAALMLALERTEGDIVILGGTGTRLDHVLGNISVLGKAFSFHRNAVLLDPHNRIRLVKDTWSIARKDQFGKYVSVFPMQGTATGVTMKGFYYPLTDVTLTGYTSLGVSNEIVDEKASILVKEGTLIVIESRD